MKIDPLVRHEVGVEDQRDPAAPVVDDRKGRHRARLDPERVAKQSAEPKESRPEAPIARGPA